MVRKRKQSRQSRRKRTRNRNSVGAYGGYLLAAVVAGCWVAPGVGGGVIVLVSLALTGYTLFGAPVWCGADNRETGERCRDNAYGLLMGCYRRQHRFQKLKLAVVPRCWERLNRGLWVSPTACIATVTGLSAAVSAVGGAVKVVVG